MKKIFSLILIVVLLPAISFCQFYLEPFLGYQKDMNNFKTNLLNTGIQFAYKIKKYEILFQLQKDWPGIRHGVDSSFTLNTSLPLYSPASKEISISSFACAIGNRVKMIGKNLGSCLFIKLYTGVMIEKANITYSYDKSNYTILNPDQTQDVTGFFVSIGLEYMWQFSNGRIFCDLNFSTPPWAKLNYPSSYNLLAPVSFNVGYSFQVSKK